MLKASTVRPVVSRCSPSSAHQRAGQEVRERRQHPDPDKSSSYATVSSEPPLPAGVDLPPGFAALPQMQSHDYVQGPPPPPVAIDCDLYDWGDDGLLHITYTGTAQRLFSDRSRGSSRRSLLFLIICFIIVFRPRQEEEEEEEVQVQE